MDNILDKFDLPTSDEDIRKTIDDMENRVKGQSSNFNSDNFFLFRQPLPLYKPDFGDNFIRILPAIKDSITRWFRADIYVHYLKEGQLLCYNSFTADRLGSLKCPVEVFCESFNDKVLSYKLKPAKRSLLWVVDAKDDDSINEGVKLWIAPISLVDTIHGNMRQKRTGKIIDIVNIKTGRIVSFVKMKNQRSKIGVEYRNVVIEEELPARSEWLDQIAEYGSFEDLLNIYDYDRITAFLKENYSPVPETVKKEDEPQVEGDRPECFGIEKPDIDKSKCASCPYFADCIKRYLKK